MPHDFFLKLIDQLIFFLDFFVQVALFFLVRAVQLIHGLLVELNLLLNLGILLLLRLKRLDIL